MARLDCKDEAVSATESCLGEAQFQKAYARYVSLRRTTAAAIRLDGPDHVLRAIGAGMSKMLQDANADPAAIYYRFQGAAEACAAAGGTDCAGCVDAHLQSLHEKNAIEARSIPPSSAASVRPSHGWLRENCGLVSPSRFDAPSPPQLQDDRHEACQTH